MWLLLAIGCIVLGLKASSFSFTLALIPFAIGLWCFSKSNRESLETFMAFAFIFTVVGLAFNILISVW
ncbi:hypothetical protein [Aeromonas caviae]|uniref:hypothetical protein n=1 Tax=Aeromonas caviae TaxID=648 RepID=UPI00191CEE46|nr:hypothetical protein [Aeromonas caviae]MBL0516177.1 hypothetical protein [Aeromonas caviae]